MRSALAFLAVSIALGGCIPRTLWNTTGGQQNDSLLYMDDLHCALLQAGPSNAPKAFKVVDDESYAIAPQGKRFGILTQPHDYDLRPDREPGVLYVRDRVYLVDASGKRFDHNWKDGLWKLHFVLDASNGRNTRDFEMNLWTIYYNPLIHGPPN